MKVFILFLYLTVILALSSIGSCVSEEADLLKKFHDEREKWVTLYNSDKENTTDKSLDRLGASMCTLGRKLLKLVPSKVGDKLDKVPQNLSDAYNARNSQAATKLSGPADAFYNISKISYRDVTKDLTKSHEKVELLKLFRESTAASALIFKTLLNSSCPGGYNNKLKNMADGYGRSISTILSLLKKYSFDDKASSKQLSDVTKPMSDVSSQLETKKATAQDLQKKVITSADKYLQKLKTFVEQNAQGQTVSKNLTQEADSVFESLIIDLSKYGVDVKSDASILEKENESGVEFAMSS